MNKHILLYAHRAKTNFILKLYSELIKINNKNADFSF